jgi:hypothetical protein
MVQAVHALLPFVPSLSKHRFSLYRGAENKAALRQAQGERI